MRFATIGTNFIVDRFLSAAKLCEGFELTAVCSRSMETGRLFAGRREGVKVYDSLIDLAATPDIDAVYIASPTSFHAEQAVMMLESGKHVLCEKPAASNRREWAAMLKAAAKSGTIVMEAMRPLFSPGYQAVKESLAELGAIRMASFRFCQYSSRYDKFKQGIIENAFRPEFSNGALMDIGIYCVASMIGLFGKPVSIRSSSYTLKDSIDGMGYISAVYDGLLGSISYSKITGSAPGCEIQGEAGNLFYDNIGSPENVRIKKRTGSERIVYDQPAGQDMKYEIQAFMNMVNGIEEPEGFQQTTLATLELTDIIRRQNDIWFPADDRSNKAYLLTENKNNDIINSSDNNVN